MWEPALYTGFQAPGITVGNFRFGYRNVLHGLYTEHTNLWIFRLDNITDFSGVIFCPAIHMHDKGREESCPELWRK